MAAFTALSAAMALVWGAGPAPATAASGELSGVPAHGAMGLAVWGGGGVSALVGDASGLGCTVQSIAANGSHGGDAVLYLPGAPALVNGAFLAAYPGGELPETAVGIRCASPSSAYALMVSDSADRSPAEPLPGAELLGLVYVFVAPVDDVWHVEFHIDDPLAAGEPASDVWDAPYDLAGAVFGGNAGPFDTSALEPGPHTLTAVIHRRGFERPTEVATAQFRVRGSDLALADLGSGELQGAQLAGADLRGANLSGADLAGADLQHARLGEASLRGADLQGAAFMGADLTEADLRLSLPASADFSGATLARARLDSVDLSGARLAGADLRGASFTFANLRAADLTGADARGANFNSAHIGCVQPSALTPCAGGGDLSGAILSGARFVGADVRGVVFTGATVHGADFTGADLRGSLLFGVDLGTVIWGGTTCPDGTLSDDHGAEGCQTHLFPDPALHIEIGDAIG